MSEKLRVEDIVILNEKQCIKKVIYDNYGTIEKCSEAMEGFPTAESIKTYMRGQTEIPEKFKNRLRQFLNIGYEEIYLTPEMQLLRYIESIDTNGSKYDSLDDLEVFDKIGLLCKDLKFYAGQGKLYQVCGDFYLRLGGSERAFKYYIEAIDLLESKCRDYNYIIEAIYHCADAAHRQQNSSLASEFYIKADEIFSKHQKNIEKKHGFFLYYFYGRHLLHQDLYDEAREKFILAESYGQDARSKASALSNIGVTYKKQGDYEKSIEYQKAAINIIGNEYDITKISLYNNLAETYRYAGRLSDAADSVEIGFRLYQGIEDKKDDVVMVKLMHLYDTLVNINAERGRSDSTMDILKNYINNYESMGGNKHFIIDHINALIKVAKARNDIKELNEIAHVIKSLLDKYKDKVYSNFCHNLKACLGEIMLQTII